MAEKQLVKISDDVDTPKLYSSKYTSEPSFVKHGIYLRENKKTYEKLFICNGNLVGKYKYPKITPKFYSPRINDYNLHLVGGWYWPNVIQEEAIYRVLEGKKPMGFFSSFDKKKRDSLVELITDDGAWPYVTNEVEHTPGNITYEVGVAVPATFEDIFDMDSLTVDYLAYASAVKETDENTGHLVNHLTYLRDCDIDEFLYNNYSNLDSNEDIITTGLVLGYSIETTASFIFKV